MRGEVWEMLYHRQTRKSGETVLLAGSRYTVDAVLGLGGSCVVYTAHYRDLLNPSHSHHVLLKELYPFQPKGEIYRGEGGEIRCTPAARPAFESAKAAFSQGNRINLELLEKLPEETPGNLISCEAYGTYYSVLSVHGGESLEARLERGEPVSLRAAGELLGQILQALEGFHKNGMLHLDVSPDNILLLSSRAMLIDYNSCWAASGASDGELRFSVKPGYSAPEVLLRDVSSVGRASDLYAVCAVFFRLLMGRPMTGAEQGGRLRRGEVEAAPAFRGEPATAVSKALSILRRGLHPLPRKRYQTTEDLAADLAELLRRIDGCGVTLSALWELSAAQARVWAREPYLEQRIALDGAGTDRESLYRRLCRGGAVLLKGPGGMGKSTLLTLLQREHLEPYREGQAVPVYVPLVDYQQAGGPAGFVRNYLLRRLKLERGAQVQDALLSLNRLLERRTGEAPLILLLDGLNEAGRHREPLLRELEGLAASGGVGILVTDRSGAVKEYALASFQTAELLPLTEDAVRARLEDQGLPVPEQDQTMQLLQNPMLLTLYCKAGGLEGADGGARATRDGIVGAYLDSLCQRELRLDSGDAAMELRHRYLLGHLLPEAALLQRRTGRPLSTRELYRVVDRGRRRLRRRAYGLAFQTFLGKSRLIFQGFQTGAEWFDFAVTEQLVQELNLLVCREGGRYGLAHDNFLPYLAQRAEANRRVYARSAWKGWAVKGGALLLGVLAVCWGGARAYRQYAADREPVYTVQQAALVNNRLEYLAMNLQALNSQWTAVDQVLTCIETGASGDELEREVLRQQQALAWCGKRLHRDDSFSTGVAGFTGGIVSEQLQALYAHPGELEGFLDQMLGYVQGRFCPGGGEGLYLSDGEKRRELAAAFRAWLERDQSVCFLRYSLLIQNLPADSREVLEENMRYLSAFAAYIADVPPGADLEESLEKALLLLEDAQKGVEAKLAAYEEAAQAGGA